MHITVCVCVCVCVCVDMVIVSYPIMVDSHSEHRFAALPSLEKGSRKPVLGVCDRLQYLRFCLLKCMLMYFLSTDVCTAQ